MAPAALAGLRVVEIGTTVAPGFAGRWLAAFGARVVKVEIPESAWMRTYSPTVDGAARDDARGPLATYLDAGKRTVAVDPSRGSGELRDLVASCDVLVHDLAPADIARVGLDALPAHVVEVALTPFGSSGPYADHQATSIVLLALGGYQFVTGEPGREPLMLPGFQPEYLTAFYGVIAALSGVLARASGTRRFEISAMEAVASLHQFTVSQWLSAGTVRSRQGNRWENNHPIAMLPCRDGYVALSAPNPEMWRRFCAMIERPDLASDPLFATPDLRKKNADALDEIILPWLRERDMAELFTVVQERWRLPINPYADLDAVLRDPQYAARGFWVPASTGSGARAVLQPGMPVVMSETPWSIDGPRAATAPVAAHARAEARDTALAPGHASAARPLSGIRVLDLTRVWSGPLCTRLLADLGAEVIRVEPPLGVGTQPSTGAPVVDAASAHEPRPTAGPGKLARNKLSVGIDLRVPEGRALVARLAAKCDVLVENFSVRVMPGFGLGYDALSAINPALIYVAMSGYGTTGPYREYVAFGSATEAMLGMTALLGYVGEPPLNSGIAYPDAVAGLAGASAALTALVYRARTGRGQLVDLSQLEPTTMMLGEFFLAAQMEGRQPPRAGNTHPVWAPHGTYRCRGVDEWISLAIRSDAEWTGFCRVAELAHLADDPRYRTARERRAHDVELDREISSWTTKQDKLEAMDALQRAGIPAGAVLSAKDLVENEHLRARGFFVDAAAPERSYPMPGTPIVVNGAKRSSWRAAPYRGEHNQLVLGDILGLTADEIAALVAAGAVVGGPRR